MNNDVVIIQNIYIKLMEGKRHKTIVFYHNRKLECIRVDVRVNDFKVGDKVRYRELKSLEI